MTKTDDQLLKPIQDFRNRLLLSGYRHANGAGELVSEDGTTWVGTGFTHGEIRIYMWRRPRGYGRPEGRCYFSVTAVTNEDELVRLGAWLALYAHQPPQDTEFAWPYPNTVKASVEA